MTLESEGGPLTESRPHEAAATQPSAIVHRGDDTVDELLAVARSYREAARAIADDSSLSVAARCYALRELNRRARQEIMPAFAEAAVWGGSRHLFEGDRQVPRDVIEANHRLIRRGHSNCPECRRPLPSVDDLHRWRRLGHEMHHRRSA